MKKAFTMIELIFVVIIIGIISAVSYSSFQRDELVEATHQVLEHIRYTQHLALTENKFDPMDKKFVTNPNYSSSNNGLWSASKWEIRFYSYSSGSDIRYAIFSDNNRKGWIDASRAYVEPAIDPMTRKWLYAYDDTNYNDVNNDNMRLTTTYNVNKVEFQGGCALANFGWSPSAGGSSKVGRVIFDSLGRPYSGVDSTINHPNKYILSQDCNIVMTHAGDNRTATITVKPESGYAFISSIN
jgi:prepilin-type N-terminal cleavage/methylation domain-containing protein